MKDKRNLLKIASLIQILYVVVYVIYYIIKGKLNDEVIANIFFLLITLVAAIILFILSNKPIDELKKNKIGVIVCSAILFINSILPGILGFIFLKKISPTKKKNINLPETKDINNNKIKLKSIISIFIFFMIMFILPRFSFSNIIPIYVIYIFIIISTLILNFEQLKNDFIVFKNNKKVYIKYVFKRYLVTLGVMFLAAIPIMLFNNNAVSANQEMVNDMMKKMPFWTFVLSTFYAPVVEETIFRLALNKIFNNKYIFLILSALLFGLAHMLDKFTSLNDILYVIQYSLLGLCLAKTYYDSKNIYTSMGVHFIQNFLASIISILMFK